MVKSTISDTESKKSTKSEGEKKKKTTCFCFQRKARVVKKVDSDELTPEEEERRYQLAINGWAKVRKLLMAARMKSLKDQIGTVKTQFEKKSIWSYERWVIDPNSKFKFWWKFLVTLILLYSIVMIPFMLSFQYYTRLLKNVDMVCDAFLLIDLILHFFYAFVNKRQKVERRFCEICSKYLFGMLLFDLLALFPYYLSDGLQRFHWLKLFRLMRISHVVAFISTALNEILLKLTSNINFTLSLTRIIIFGLLLLLAAQCIGCVWFYIGYHNLSNDKGWIHQLLLKEGKLSYDQTTTYITSIYWVFTTLSTLGYGDFYPVQINEYLFTMLIEFMGVFLFAYMMGNINNLIEKLDDDVDEYLQNELTKLDQWLMKIDRANSHRKLKHEMVDKITDSLSTYWKLDHVVIQKNNFLDQLPIKMRKKLINHLFCGFFDQFSIFFDGLEEGFQHQIVINLYPRKFRTTEDIISIDAGTKHLFFLTKGKVCIGTKDVITKYVILDEGTYFGDYLIFFRLKSSNCYRPLEDVKLMCINKNKFLTICDMYPKSAKILKYKAYLRRKFIRAQKLKSQQIFKIKKNREDQGKDKKLINDLSKDQKPMKQFDAIEKDEFWSESDEDQANLNHHVQYDAENEIRKTQLIERSKALSNELDRLADKINSIEGDFHKKLKSLRSHVDFLSHFEDYFQKKNIAY